MTFLHSRSNQVEAKQNSLQWPVLCTMHLALCTFHHAHCTLHTAHCDAAHFAHYKQCTMQGVSIRYSA